MSFAHLHVHTEYSLLDGLSKIPKLVARAQELGMPALAITDHGTMFGTIEFYTTCKKAGIKPIIGVEAYLAARSMRDKDHQEDRKSSHLLLLAQNEVGYRNLLQIATASQLEGFYYYPRIDHDFLAGHAEGLLCTTGCLSGEVPRAILEGNLAAARRKLDWYFEVFGHENFFFEVQDHDIPELDSVNKALLELAPRYRAQFVATNDVHYLRPEDAPLHDVLLCIQTNSLLAQEDRMRMPTQSFYLRSPEEMKRLFGEIPGAVSNTLAIAERCWVDLDFKGYHLPHFPVPEGFTAESYLHHLCQEGADQRFPAASEAKRRAIQERLDYELGVIHKMGFETYFLIVWDLCSFARERGIWYNARGSAAGSMVAYCLGITLVDPLQHGLIFERFLNPGRVSMPDIDLDFQDDRRWELLEYTVRKYGESNVAQIITFGTLAARAAIRDVGRVMDIPLPEVDRVTKLVPAIPGKSVTIPETLEQVEAFKQAYQSADYLKELIDTAAKLEGVARNAGTHAAGVIIADKPIVEYVPLHRPTKGAAEESAIKSVTQFEMSIIEKLGLLKVDFLGLATLTVMARACELIEQRHGVRYSLNNIPSDDPKIYELLGRGEVLGVFQVESTGMRRYLTEMKPTKLEHIIAMVALYRPGPIDFIPTYIKRMHGEEKVAYRHPALAPIFEETYGIPVYQEQIMRAAVELAGYTLSESDDLRKAIAKKIKEQLMAHREKFVGGAIERGLDRRTAEAIFDDWEEFARYGFNKSHAADYAVITAQTAYLKAHYPVEYMTALLTVERNNTDKVALYTAECRRMGIEIFPPDVNRSGLDFTIEEVAPHRLTSDTQSPASGAQYAIRFGLGAIKNVGEGPVNVIMQAREAGGPFRDLEDFARRVDLRHVQKRALECLIKVGALSAFGPRQALLDHIEKIIGVSAAHHKAKDIGQMSLFGAATGVRDMINLPKNIAEAPRKEILNWEKELVGVYVSDHPLAPVMNELEAVVTAYSGQLSEEHNGQRVTLGGIVNYIRRHETKKGDPMAYVTLEDLQGTIEVLLFPKVWKEAGQWLAPEQIVVVTGRVDAKGSEAKILADTITKDIHAAPAAAALLHSARPTSGQRRPTQAAASAKLMADSRVSKSSPSNPSSPPLEELEENPPFDPWDLFPPDDAMKSETTDGIPTDAPLAPGEAALQAGGNGNPEASPNVGNRPNGGNPAEVTAPPRSRISNLPSPVAPVLLRESSTDYPVSASAGPVKVVVRLDPTGDSEMDKRRLRRVHGLLTSSPGQDHFVLVVFERGRWHQLEFPNDTTDFTPTLAMQLQTLLGPDSVSVSPL